jgi:hypothetical protein
LLLVGIPVEYLQLISKFCTIVKEDENVDVVYAVLEGYQKILKDVPQVVNIPVEGTGSTTSNGMLIATVVKTVITEKVKI